MQECLPCCSHMSKPVLASHKVHLLVSQTLHNFICSCRHNQTSRNRSTWCSIGLHTSILLLPHISKPQFPLTCTPQMAIHMYLSTKPRLSFLGLPQNQPHCTSTCHSLHDKPVLASHSFHLPFTAVTTLCSPLHIFISRCLQDLD